MPHFFSLFPPHWPIFHFSLGSLAAQSGSPYFFCFIFTSAHLSFQSKWPTFVFSYLSQSRRRHPMLVAPPLSAHHPRRPCAPRSRLEALPIPFPSLGNVHLIASPPRCHPSFKNDYLESTTTGRRLPLMDCSCSRRSAPKKGMETSVFANLVDPHLSLLPSLLGRSLLVNYRQPLDL
jgi:hypothetical protein